MTRVGFALALAFAAPAGRADCLIQGHVVDAETGKPIAGARVLAKPRPRLTKPAIQRFSDAQGAFCFDALDGQHYQLAADRAGYLSAASIDIDVGGPARTLKMIRSGSIAGMVLGSDGEPLEAADVRLWRKVWDREDRRFRSDEIDRGATDDRGLFRFGPLAPGNYYLGAKLRSSFWITLYGGNSFDRARAIPVVPGENAGGLTITLPDSGGRTLSARLGPGVQADEKATLSQHRIDIESNSTSSASFQPDGTVTFDNLPPGRYFVQSTGVEPRVSAEVDLAEHDVTGLVLAPTTRYEVQVLLIGGPSELGNVVVTAWETTTGEVYTLDHRYGGFWSNGIPAGNYRLALTGELGYLKSLVLDGQPHADTVLDLRTVRPKRVEAVFSPGLARLSGHVPPGDREIQVAWMDEEGFSGSRPVDAAGAFQLPKLAPGKYRLFAIEGFDEDLWGGPDLAAALHGKSLELELKESDDRQVTLAVISAAEWAAALRKAGM